MFAEWVTTGVSWGVMVASAAVTLFAFLGFVVGLLSIGAWFLKGGHDDEDKKDKENDNFNRPSKFA